MFEIWKGITQSPINFIQHKMSTTTGDEPEVRAEDQEQINEFGRMNNRLLELRAEMKQLKADSEKLDDANTELMMASGEGKTMLLMGEAFVEVSEDYATECKC